MKNFVLFSFCLLFTTFTSALAQDMIPNHSFEQWDGAPVNWVNPLAIAGINNIEPSNDAQSGDLSARFYTAWSENTNEYVPATLNSLPAPVTEKHTTLNGYFKGTSVEGDVLSITVFLYSDGMIAGNGFFSTDETTTDWTTFSVPITYISEETPTDAYFYIIVGSEDGGANDGTEYLLDNLTWDGASGIHALQSVSDLNLSPNPAEDEIMVQFSLDEPDHILFELISLTGQVILVAPEQRFNAGKNSLKINLSDQNPGLYVIRATGGQYGFSEKVMVR